jgi:hypothetical protein
LLDKIEAVEKEVAAWRDGNAVSDEAMIYISQVLEVR